MALPPIAHGWTESNDPVGWFTSFDGVWVQIAPTPFVTDITKAHTPALNETSLCTSGTFPVTLPNPMTNADNSVVNTGTGTITVQPPAGISLYGLTGASGNISLTQGQSARIRSDGSAWYRVQ